MLFSYKNKKQVEQELNKAYRMGVEAFENGQSWHYPANAGLQYLCEGRSWWESRTGATSEEIIRSFMQGYRAATAVFNDTQFDNLARSA